MNDKRFQSLMVRILSREAHDTERFEFERLLETSPEHQEQFTEAETVWEATRVPQQDDAADTEQTWGELSQLLELPEQGRVVPVPTKRWYRYPAVAAVAAAVLVVLFGSLYINSNRPDNMPVVSAPSGQQEVATANGERQLVLLPDGSTAHLNAASRLVYQTAFSDSLRLVRLDGEAFFNVVADGRPFVIHSGQAKIRVLGTAFNVRTRNNRTRVIVREGRVSLAAVDVPAASGVVLTADQMGIHLPSAPLEPPRIVDADYLLGWLNGNLVFDQHTVRELSGELERVYDVTIQIDDPELEQRRVTAVFPEQPIDRVLEAVCLTLNARYEHTDGVYRLFY